MTALRSPAAFILIPMRPIQGSIGRQSLLGAVACRSHSRAVSPFRCRDRRPACLPSLSVRSVATLVCIQSAQYLPHELVEPVECHPSLQSGNAPYAQKRTRHGARKNGFVAQQGPR